MEPLLGPVSPFLISSDLRLQLRNPIFGCAQLMRELLRRLQRVPAVFFCNASRFVEQLQDRLARFVELIGIARCSTCGSPRERNDVRLVVVATNCTMHHSALPSTLDRSYCWRECSIVASSAHRTSSIAKSVLLFVPVTYAQQS